MRSQCGPKRGEEWRPDRRTRSGLRTRKTNVDDPESTEAMTPSTVIRPNSDDSRSSARAGSARAAAVTSSTVIPTRSVRTDFTSTCDTQHGGEGFHHVASGPSHHGTRPAFRLAWSRGTRVPRYLEKASAAAAE